MLKIMPDTYGVMVYQEDVIKVAHIYAGLTLAESDILRRGMSGKYRSREEFQRVKDRFFSNCTGKGYPEHESAEIWRQIESFAGYSFAKGHSASYAVESYQSLYLKAYHPLEFMVAVANNFGGFYHTEFYLHEAKRAGAVVEAPCVNRSEELCTLQRVASGEQNSDLPLATRHSPLIFIGLHNIKSLDATTTDRLLSERRRHGPFAHLPDLLKRVPIDVEHARILIRAGALRFTGRTKQQLLWDLTLLHNSHRHVHLPDLFITKPPATKLPTLEHFDLSDAYDELELLGFPLCDPFLLVENAGEDGEKSEGGEKVRSPLHTATLAPPSPPSLLSPPSPFSPPWISARDMPRHIGKRVSMLGYVVHVKPTKTGAGERMSFGCFIDRAGDFWDSTQFPIVEAKYPFRGRGVYRLAGKVEQEFGHCTLNVEHVEKLPWRTDPRYGPK
jgi:DNA polymerase-3 subunit alpha